MMQVNGQEVKAVAADDNDNDSSVVDDDDVDDTDAKNTSRNSYRCQ